MNQHLPSWHSHRSCRRVRAGALHRIFTANIPNRDTSRASSLKRPKGEVVFLGDWRAAEGRRLTPAG
jgi:hypothetical protein